MIRRIILENYMSHGRTVIEPAPGLTVLVGPNNCGKSAVLSAIQAVCGETASDYMVRHGEKVCRVTIETHDGHTIAWQRKGGATSYTIDGTDIHRVGRGRNGLPDDLHTLLRMPVTESPAGRKFQVHFGSQKDPIFLLGSESDTAAFFSSSAESERLMEMQKRHKTKVAARRNEQKTIEADLQQLSAKLQALEPLAALGPAVEQLEAEHQSELESGRAADLLAQRIDRLALLRQQIDRLSAELQISANLQPLPDQADPTPLSLLIGSMERSLSAASLLSVEAQALDTLTEPPALQDTGPLETLGKALRVAELQATRAGAAAAVLDPLNDVPGQEDLTTFEAFLLHLQRANAAAKAAAVELSATEQTLAAVEAEIVRFVTRHPLCPTCGGPLTANHVMHGGLEHVVQT